MIDQIRRIAEALAENPDSSPQQATVREILNWYGAKRRGDNVVARIRSDLEEYNLITDPDFESAWIDLSLNFIIVKKQNDIKNDENQEEQILENGQNIQSASVTSTPTYRGVSDPTHQLSKLKAANQNVLSVSPNDSISVAVTKMLLHNYSQIPVMVGDRNVKGVISWKSLGAHTTLCRDGREAKDAMDEAKELPYNSSIFDAIGIVAQHDYVLVRDSTNRISGIVTASDLTDQFRNLSEPFLLLSEIENHLRNMLSREFQIDDYKSVRPTEDQREISSVSDLTFGEYIRLLESPKNWERLKINLDRSYFCERLEVVRKTRNEVMHFDPDGIDPEQFRALEEFSKILRTIQKK